MEIPKNKFVSGEDLGFKVFTPAELKRYSQALAKAHMEGKPITKVTQNITKEFIKGNNS